jgi:hypothetical protein
MNKCYHLIILSAKAASCRPRLLTYLGLICVQLTQNGVVDFCILKKLSQTLG